MFGELPMGVSSSAINTVSVFFEGKPRMPPLADCGPMPCELTDGAHFIGLRRWEIRLCETHSRWYWRAAN